MDAFKAQFERITQQLSALSSTQKMLVAALVVIMVMSMLYWGKYAQNSEMVSLLGEQSLTADDIGPIDRQLELSGVTHTVVGDKIMVPTDRRSELLANLMFAHALPSDTHSAFETMTKNLNPFSTNDERETTYTNATAAELSDIISRFPGVATAHVVINAKSFEGIEDTVKPSATVVITTRGTPDDPKGLARAAADGVAHAVSNLSVSQIAVIINRTSIHVHEGDGISDADDLNDARRHREEELEQKIKNYLMISDLSVAVNCDVDNRTTETTDSRFDKNGTLVLPEHTTSKTNETVSSNPVPREPGVGSNLGAGTNGPVTVDGAAAPAGGSPNTTSMQEDTADNKVLAGEHTQHQRIPAGKDMVVSAAIRVPLSYFPGAYKRLHPSAATPDEVTLSTATNDELNRIRNDVKNILALKDDKDLSVDFYADAPVDTGTMAAAAVPVGTLGAVKSNAKEISIGALAIISLLMMAMLVRRPPAPVLAVSSGDAGEDSVSAASRAAGLKASENLAGEAIAGDEALDGVEMDDDSVKTKQVMTQVTSMVKQDPDAAAALVKRWLKP